MCDENSHLLMWFTSLVGVATNLMVEFVDVIHIASNNGYGLLSCESDSICVLY